MDMSSILSLQEVANSTSSTVEPTPEQNATISGNETAGEYDVEETSENYVKVAIIVLKICYVITMMTFAIIAYRRRHRRTVTQETSVFAFFIIIMFSLLIFDLFAKYIIMLYFMILLTNFLSFQVFNYMIDHYHATHGDVMRAKFLPFKYLMYTLFFLAFIAAFLPNIGVKCTEDHQYPHTFFFVIGCHIFFTLLVQFFYHTNYFIPKHREPQNEGEKVIVDIFKKQTKIYVVYNTILCVAQIILTIYGAVRIEKGEDIQCLEDGTKWKFVTQYGNLFSTLHIFVIIFQAIMIEKIFYGVPHKMGYFHDEHHHEHHEHEHEVKQETKTDDDYHRV